MKLLTPSSHRLSKDEVLGIPYFNQLSKNDIGKLLFHGKDENGNDVYTLARRRFKQIVPVIKDFYFILEGKFALNEQIILSNTSPTVPLAMTFGGMFSRGLGIDFIGVPLLVKGAQQCCNSIYQLVEHTKKTALEQNDSVVILDNKNFKE